MKLLKLSVFGLFLGLMFNSCKNGDSDISGGNETSGAYMGGNKVIRIAEVTAPSSLFPHKLTVSVEALISRQIFEGLVKIDPKTLKVMPALAEKWEISSDSKTITFHLRKGVKFQKTGPLANKNVELTSKDVKFTFELLCNDNVNNVHFGTVCKDRVVGANEVYEKSKSGEKVELKGFKLIDDYTFSIELLNSPNVFLEILGSPAAAILSEEAYNADHENTTVGAGPFILDAAKTNKTHYVLYKNIEFYGKDKKGNALPYLDSLVVDVVPSTEVAWEGFKSGRFDFISSIPTNQLKQIVEENIKSFKGHPPTYLLERNAEMITQFYVFNIHKAPFNNQKLRQAINYAIDRDRIIDRVLFGQAFGPATHGIVPPTFDFYKIENIEGYRFDLEKAKQLMKEAGYPDGKGLPEIQLLVSSGDSRNNSVAAEIQKQLSANLNINVTFESLPNATKYLLQAKGKGDLFRDGWVADYPSPESFLSVFYGEPVNPDTSKISYPNTIRFVNKDFDMNYKLGRDASNRDTAAVYFMKAEKILLEQAPIIPLWYESNYRLISTRLKNFYVNPLRYFDFTEVDLGENKLEEKK